MPWRHGARRLVERETPGHDLASAWYAWPSMDTWGGDPPDLFQPKLTLLSSGLLGFPERGLIRSNIPLWVPGTSYHFKKENPLAPESP